MNRLYLLPVMYECNAACTFCISDIDAPKFQAKPPYFPIATLLKSLEKYAALSVKEVEITGGGEPFLHPQLQNIIDALRYTWPSIYIKLYTNGFRHRPIRGVDELNISRCHDDTEKNNELYRATKPTDLIETLAYFRPMVPKIRLQVTTLKGYIDSPEAAIALIERVPMVDTFVFRPLFDKCGLEKDKYVEFKVDHPKAKNDLTGDYCDTRPILATDGVLYHDWSFQNLVTEIAAVNADLNSFRPTERR